MPFVVADEKKTESFWEIGNYKRTVRRVEDGYKLCNSLMEMINERADLENAYAKSLKNWSSKWYNFYEHGPEYGTLENACKSFVQEAESVAKLHTEIKEKLVGATPNVNLNLYDEVKKWRDENYKKSLIGNCKETKELDQEFHQAQKPWSKLTVKHLKSKKEYYSACKQLKEAQNQLKIDSNSKLSDIERKKLSDKVEKFQLDVQSTKLNYETALKNLTSLTSKYIQDMTQVFEKSQMDEKKRMDFFKNCLKKMQHSLIENHDYSGIINLADSDKDLRFWSENHGIDMDMNWPEFQEFHLDNNDDNIDKSSHSKNITNTIADGQGNNSKKKQSPTVCDATPPPSNYDVAYNDELNPFSNDEHKEKLPEMPELTLPKAAVKVRALFDYKASDADEISFKVNDTFLQIEEANEQGWCKGLKDNVEGLFPVGYVEEY